MSIFTATAEAFRPLHDKIFVTDLESGPRLTRGGLIIPDDNMKDRGIRPRWARVYSVGPKATGVVPGDWVMIEHGRWTNGFDLSLPTGIIRLWMIDPAAILVASDDDPLQTSRAVL